MVREQKMGNLKNYKIVKATELIN